MHKGHSAAHKVHMGGERFAKSVHQDRHARHIVPVLSIWLARDTDASLWMFDSGPGCSCPLPPGLIVGLVRHCLDGILVLSSSFQRRLDRVIPAAASSSHVLVVLTVTR